MTRHDYRAHVAWRDGIREAQANAAVRVTHRNRKPASPRRWRWLAWLPGLAD